MISNYRVPPKQWCAERAASQLAIKSIGRIGNAYGTLRADLMRHLDTAPLVPLLDELDGSEEALVKFIKEYLS